MSTNADSPPPSAPKGGVSRVSKKKVASKSGKVEGGGGNGDEYPSITRFLKSQSAPDAFAAKASTESHIVSYTHVVASNDTKRAYTTPATPSATKDSGHNAILHLFVPASSGGNPSSSIEKQPPLSNKASDMDPLLCVSHGGCAISAASPESDIAGPTPMPYNRVDGCVFERSRHCVYSSLDAPTADVCSVGNMSNPSDITHTPYFVGGGSRDAPTPGQSVVGLAGARGMNCGAAYAGGAGCLKQGVVRLLSDFWQKSRNGEWPLNTTVHCHWCCHKFDSTPIGLPIKMSHDHALFHVIGCFCSFECACAYNFDSRESTNERLSRFTLLNNLATRVGTERVPVKPAPPRYSLDMFGGFMTIEQFRAKSSKYIIVNTAPMTSVVQLAEGLNEHDVHSDYRYVPLDDQRVNKYQEQLKLKRAKPLLGAKNTLEQSMKITITPKRNEEPPLPAPMPSGNS
jgi:hypothetical protein